MRNVRFPDRRCAFELYLKKQGFLHGLCRIHSPWQNGIIERSHRTDNEELFDRMQFETSEDRKYQLKLWEYEYNYLRPHQSLNMQTPMQVYRKRYQFHAGSRSIM